MSKIDRRRIIDHGEVFTPQGVVNDMLDLVAHECEREDSRFLEPACGDGNFLAEVLQRRLNQVGRKHYVKQQWEAHALLGLACLYGIELLPDNVQLCRTRLASIFNEAYLTFLGQRGSCEVIEAAAYILQMNIIQGNALNMTGPDGSPLVMTEWALIGRGRFKRRLFEYRELSPSSADVGSLFGATQLKNEEGQLVFVPRHLKDMPPVHYTDLANSAGKE